MLSGYSPDTPQSLSETRVAGLTPAGAATAGWVFLWRCTRITAAYNLTAQSAQIAHIAQISQISQIAQIA